jgi:hypothetical protein
MNGDNVVEINWLGIIFFFLILTAIILLIIFRL